MSEYENPEEKLAVSRRTRKRWRIIRREITCGILSVIAAPIFVIGIVVLCAGFHTNRLLFLLMPGLSAASISEKFFPPPPVQGGGWFPTLGHYVFLGFIFNTAFYCVVLYFVIHMLIVRYEAKNERASDEPDVESDEP